MKNEEIFIVGGNGQLGLALREQYPGARWADISELDITDKASVQAFDWSTTKYILNAAAYTNVDGAETPEGRIAAWKVNATAVSYLAEVANWVDATLVHISTDYVFDGTQNPHLETEPFSPLSVYCASKAAGDIVAALADKHFILRTSWVVGEGKNFVRTMLDIGKKGINPSVVNDQIGRLTFTAELVRAVDHLLTSELDYGTYNVTNDGTSASWADIAREVYRLADMPNTVTDVTTAQYYEGKTGIAARPLQSTLDLGKIQSSGFVSTDWREALATYIKKELETK